MTKTNMIRSVVLILLTVLYCNLSDAKENYIPGYIIKNNNDTIKGYIDYLNWNKNPEYIQFRTARNSASTSLSPTDIKEFSANNEIYISGIVEVENTSLSNNNLVQGFKSRITIDTVFLQNLVRGEKSLYFYKNSDGRNNFYISRDDGYELLIYIKYLLTQNEISVPKVNDGYLYQLENYLNDCENIKDILKNVSYTKNNLLRLFKEYYECAPYDAEIQTDINTIHTETGVLAGVSSTSLNFTSWSSIYDDLTTVDYGISRDYTIGVTFNLVTPWLKSKFSINNELLYTSYKLQSIKSYGTNEDIYNNTTTEFNYNYLKINSLANYRCIMGNSSLFFNAGISNGFATKERYYKKVERYVYSQYIVNEVPALDFVRSHEIGWVIGTGIKYKNLSYEIRYERGNGMSDLINLVSTTERYYFLLAYWFK